MSCIDSKFNLNGPGSALEKMYILEYLNSKGYCFRDLKLLSKKKSHCLMKEACSYASLKLTEIESRAQFLQKIDIAD